MSALINCSGCSGNAYEHLVLIYNFWCSCNTFIFTTFKFQDLNQNALDFISYAEHSGQIS